MEWGDGCERRGLSSARGALLKHPSSFSVCPGDQSQTKWDFPVHLGGLPIKGLREVCL